MPSSSQRSVQQRSIKSQSTGNQLVVEFSPENTEAINELVVFGRFGLNGEDVVLTAVSLLWNIYSQRRDAQSIIAQGPSGRTAIDL